ncbi:MAG: dihydrolipoamide acetyltransferase family protein [Actinomycetota bacterium]
MGEREFVLPDLGEGLEEAEIAAWLVEEGDPVALNQPLVEVETAKATVEIPSPFAGMVARLHAAAGDTVKVGAPLVTFDMEDSEGGGGRAPLAGPSPIPLRSAPAPAATPAVRKLAKELGVDLPTVEGTGTGGRVTREDVEAAAESVPGERDVEIVPVGLVRRAVADSLTRAVREIPHVTTFRTVDCSHLEAFRAELGVSPLPVVIRALAGIVQNHPMLNASFHAASGAIHIHRHCHVGVATDTDRGLVVPVIRGVGDLGLAGVAAEILRLVEAARAWTITPAEMTGGTITVTNTGSYGSEFGTPIINPPQGAILALGVIEPRALVVEDVVVARPACTLSLSFDHRLLDGATAGRALSELVDLLESRARLEALPR